MSLKVFHIVFITVSILTSWGFAAWALKTWLLSKSPLICALGIASLVFGMLLVVYEINFIRKTQKL